MEVPDAPGRSPKQEEMERGCTVFQTVSQLAEGCDFSPSARATNATYILFLNRERLTAAVVM
jgi:hypothetical protein